MVPDSGSERYYDRLERVLKGILLRLKLFVALELLLRLVGLFLIVLLGGLFIQETASLWPYFPFAYFSLALMSLFLVFLLGLWKTAVRISLERVARGLEEKIPRLKDDVTNAFLLYPQISTGRESDPTSTKLIHAHLRKTIGAVSTIKPDQVINFKYLRKYLNVFIPLIFAVGAIFIWDAKLPKKSLSMIFDPFSALPEPETHISVKPTPPVVLRGTSLVIRATASGRVPDRLTLSLWPENVEIIRFAMSSEGEGRFTHRIHAVQRSFRYQVAGTRAQSPVYVVRVVDAPDIGKLQLTLIPPAYTRLPQELKTQGHIAALKGTIVNLEAWTTKAVTEAKLILNQKAHRLLAVDGDRLTGNLLVMHPGTYSLSVRDALGFENSAPVPYNIHLIPDKYPEAEIMSPTGDLVITGREVLPLVYRARDDFGLTSVRLICQVRGKERVVTLKNLKETSEEGPEMYQWDLSYLSLAPGDRVAYRLEVLDNDTISGPKAGYSRTFTLQTRDEKDRAAQEAARAERIADAMLDLLADQLEAIKDRKELSEAMDQIMEMIDRQLEWMKAEQAERFDLESLRRNLATLNRRIDVLPRETITQEMERLALLAEDLAKKTRMQELEALAREINSRQRRLIESMKDRKEPITSDQLRDLLKEIDNLKALISKVMEALSKMANHLPDEFINNPELGDMEFRDLFKDLEEIQQKLMAGDTPGALEAAQRLLETLSKMMAAMSQAGTQARMGSLDRLQSEMSRQAGELDNILEAQKKILKDTEGVDRKLKQTLAQETGKRIDENMPRLKDGAAQLRGQLSGEEKDAVSALERLIDERKIDKLLQLLESLEESVSEKSDVRHRAQELANMLKRLVPDQQEIMTEENREAFPDLSSRQEKLKETTQRLEKKLEMLSQLFPGMDTEIINDIKDAEGSMGEATGKLKGEDAPGAIPPEEAAIQRLSRSQKAMQQMAQQMAQQMQANQWGTMPWGYDPRAGWYYGPWAPMPTLPQPGVKRPLERGFTGFDREEFDPPGKDVYKVPKIFREKVMEALKEDIPPQYRREVEKYFEELTK